MPLVLAAAAMVEVMLLSDSPSSRGDTGAARFRFGMKSVLILGCCGMVMMGWAVGPSSPAGLLIQMVQIIKIFHQDLSSKDLSLIVKIFH
jgi:hypothetical protein